MKTTVLHRLGDLVRDLFLQIPLETVRMLFVALPVLVLIWVLWLPGGTSTTTDSTSRSQTGLKLGAAAALLLQVVIYSLL